MPFQIIHTFEGFLEKQQLDGMTILLGRNEERLDMPEIKTLVEERLKLLQSMGIDGLVVNVGCVGYLDSTEGWNLFLKGLKAAVELGFRIWIYDEKGYPSGSAGGIVLRENPHLEALGLKHRTLKAENGSVDLLYKEKGSIEIIRCNVRYNDGVSINLNKSNSAQKLKEWEDGRRIVLQEEKIEALDVYYTGVLYEGAHASRSYAEKRRYINLLDTEAVEKFIEATHYCYESRIPKYYFDKVEAFFTDEPSFMSVILAELDGLLVQKIPVMDEPDPEVVLLPSVPYSKELEERLENTFRLKLYDVAQQIFEYNNNPSEVKCAFWEAVSLVYEQAFALTLSGACGKLDKKLTGHILAEEKPFENMIFHSNPFRILKHFQLPGVDLLSNDLRNVNIFAHKLPFSCAFLTGKKGIMSETSDFAEHRFGERKAATAEIMASSLSMQFLLGVREFSYYYDFRERNPEEYKWVNEIIKRTCSFAAEFDYNPEVAIYCPYETFWSGYVPSDVCLSKVIDEQPLYVRQTQESLIKICNEFFEKNVQFVLCDCSSIHQLVSAGVKKMIIPWCSVVSSDLIEAAKDGRIELYGHKPEFFYKSGKIGRIEHLDILPETCFEAHAIPFGYDSGLLFAAFSDNNFYCFNPGNQEIALKINPSTVVYDPFENVGSTVHGSLKVAPGRAIFLKSKN